MNDHIIKAAREAGFVVQRDEWVLQTMLRTFYAIAFRQGMERAAEICDGLDAEEFDRDRPAPNDCAAAIRAHAQNQPKNEHDGSVVSKN